MARQRKVTTDTKDSYRKLNKLKERLVIIFDVNPQSNVDPTEDDIKLLECLYEALDNLDVKWTKHEPLDEQNVTQSEINPVK